MSNDPIVSNVLAAWQALSHLMTRFDLLAETHDARSEFGIKSSYGATASLNGSVLKLSSEGFSTTAFVSPDIREPLLILIDLHNQNVIDDSAPMGFEAHVIERDNRSLRPCGS